MYLFSIPVVSLKHVPLSVVVAFSCDQDALSSFGLGIDGSLGKGARLLNADFDDHISGSGEMFERVRTST